MSTADTDLIDVLDRMGYPANTDSRANAAELLLAWADKRAEQQVREAELRGILKGRKAEVEHLAGVSQNDDRLTPDEYEAILLVLNDRGDELGKPDYPRNPTWLA